MFSVCLISRLESCRWPTASTRLHLSAFQFLRGIAVPRARLQAFQSIQLRLRGIGVCLGGTKGHGVSLPRGAWGQLEICAGKVVGASLMFLPLELLSPNWRIRSVRKLRGTCRSEARALPHASLSQGNLACIAVISTPGGASTICLWFPSRGVPWPSIIFVPLSEFVLYPVSNVLKQLIVSFA